MSACWLMAKKKNKICVAHWGNYGVEIQSFTQFERLLCALYVQLFGLFTSVSA